LGKVNIWTASSSSAEIQSSSTNSIYDQFISETSNSRSGNPSYFHFTDGRWDYPNWFDFELLNWRWE